MTIRPGVLGVHSDGTSHTGSCVLIGAVGSVHCKSAMQSIVSKSSTEAEFVALSDSSNQGLYTRNFPIAQGHEMEPVTIHQDNTSCMALIERERSGAERSRHITIRYFWVKERVESDDQAHGDQGDVCEPSDEAAARRTVSV